MATDATFEDLVQEACSIQKLSWEAMNGKFVQNVSTDGLLAQCEAYNVMLSSVESFGSDSFRVRAAKAYDFAEQVAATVKDLSSKYLVTA